MWTIPFSGKNHGLLGVTGQKGSRSGSGGKRSKFEVQEPLSCHGRIAFTKGKTWRYDMGFDSSIGYISSHWYYRWHYNMTTMLFNYQWMDIKFLQPHSKHPILVGDEPTHLWDHLGDVKYWSNWIIFVSFCIHLPWNSTPWWFLFLGYIVYTSELYISLLIKSETHPQKLVLMHVRPGFSSLGDTYRA